MIRDSSAVCLELDSRPERVALVRGMLVGLGRLLGLDAVLVDDLKTAVSEACNNVVLHAYGGACGPLVVDLRIEQDRVLAIVRDQGTGIRGIATDDDQMGVGLALIGAVADQAEFVSAVEGGTEVRMAFTGRRGPMGLPDRRAAQPREYPASPLPGEVVVTVSPVRLLRVVLGRVARALAAGAHFSLDRFADLYPVADLIADHAQTAASAAKIRFSIVAVDRRLALRIGPFTAGSCAQLGSDASLGSSALPLMRLADEVTVQQVEHGEMLSVLLVDSRCARTGSRG